jgi:phosphoribosylformylglycinamidine synthase
VRRARTARAEAASHPAPNGVAEAQRLKDTKDIFAESLSRAIVEVRYEDEAAFETFVGQNHVECTKIGTVGGDEIFINGIKKDLNEAKNIYFNRFQEIIEQDL